MLLTAIAFSNFRISIRAVGHEMEKQYKKAVDMVNAEQADLVVFTGDIVNNIATELDEFIPILRPNKRKRRSLLSTWKS